MMQVIEGLCGRQQRARRAWRRRLARILLGMCGARRRKMTVREVQHAQAHVSRRNVLSAESQSGRADRRPTSSSHATQSQQTRTESCKNKMPAPATRRHLCFGALNQADRISASEKTRTSQRPKRSGPTRRNISRKAKTNYPTGTLVPVLCIKEYNQNT